MPILVVVLLAILGGTFWSDVQFANKVDRFVIECSEKGGITLKAATKYEHAWLGCYKGVTEIYNES